MSSYKNRYKKIVAQLLWSIFMLESCSQLDLTAGVKEPQSTQQRIQQKPYATSEQEGMALTQQIKLDFSEFSIDLQAYILSFLDQKNFHRASLVCRSWREAALIAGEDKILDLSTRKLDEKDCQVLLNVPFSSLNLKKCQLRDILSQATHLKELNLSESNIDVEGAKALAKGNLGALITLNLFGNHIKVAGAKALAEGNFSSLTSLNVCKNKLGDEGAEALATGNFNKLTTLHLSRNNLKAAGAKALAKGNFSGLAVLNLYSNDLRDEGVEALATGNFTNLVFLHLSRNNLGVAGAKALATGNFSVLSSLNLSVNNLGDEGVKALLSGNLSTLIKLNLRANNLGEESVKSLDAGNLPSLAFLDLSYNYIGREGISILKMEKFAALKKLNLQRNKIRKDDRNLSTPQKVNLERNNIIEKAGKNLSILKESDLERNKIGKEGKFASYTANELSDFIYDHSKSSRALSWDDADSWLEAACEKLDDFEAQDFSGSIHSFISLKNAFNAERLEAFLTKMFQVAEDKLPTFTPHHLSGIILDLGKLLRSANKIPSSFAEAWFKVVDDQFEKFGPKHLVSSLNGLGLLGISLPDTFLNKWQDMAERLFSEFNPQNLSGSLYAFYRHRIQPSEKFLDQWNQEVLKKLTDFNHQALSISLCAFMRLSLVPTEEFLNNWNDEAISKLNGFDFETLSTAIYASAVLRLNLREEFLDRIKNRAFYFPNLANVDPGIARKFYLALRYFKIDCGFEFKEAVSNSKKSEYNKTIISLLHKEVKKGVKQIWPQIPLESEYWIDDICNSVDIAIPSRKLVIEVDGPYHFVRTNRGKFRRRFQDKLVDEILQEAGWRVIRIPHFDWQDSKGKEFLKKQLEPYHI